MKKAKVLITLAATVAVAGLAACGNKQTDQDYKMLNQPDAPSAADAMKNAASQVAPTAGQNISIKADSSPNVDVHAGKTVVITGTAQVLIAVPFTTALKDAPASATFTVANIAGVQHWTITYKAPVAGAVLKPMHVVIQLGDTTAPNQTLLAPDIAAGKSSLAVTITITKDVTKPLVTISGLDSVNPIEGLSTPFTVDVNDPSSIVSGTAPTLTVSADADSASLAGAVDVSSFIDVDASKPVQKVDDGVWRFFYHYNTVSKTLTRPKQHSSVGLDQGIGTFKMTMTSTAKETAEKSEKFNIKFDTQKQLPQFAPIKDASQLTVTLGKMNQIDVQVSSQDQTSVLKLDATATHAVLKLLSGRAQAQCDSPTSDGMLCHVRWTPKCDAATDKPENVQIKVINTVGGISAEAPWTSPDLKLIKPDNCGVKTAKVTAKGKAKAITAKTKTAKVAPAKTSKVSTAAAPKPSAAAKAPAATVPAATAAIPAGPDSAPVSGDDQTSSSGGNS